VLVRRLHLYYEHPERGIPAARRVADLIGREKAWDEERIEQETRRYEEFARR
jgi:glycerol-3-phosphate dehydrogenase